MTINRRRFLGTAIAGAGALTLGACGGGNSNPIGAASPAASGSGGGGGSVIVGSADFTESQIIGQLYSQALTAKGITSSVKGGIGSREIYIRALQDGSISVVPEYTGNLLLYFDKNATATTEKEIEAALPKAVGDLKILAASQAADQDVYVVTAEFSQQNNVKSLSDLARISNLAVGGPAELQKRSYGPPGLEKLYGIKIAKFQSYSSPAVKVKDLKDNKIQFADFFTTESAIADNGFVALSDPKTMILPQQVVPLVRADVASNTQAVAAIEAVQQALTTDELTALNKKVDSDHQDASDVAKEWLQSKNLG